MVRQLGLEAALVAAVAGAVLASQGLLAEWWAVAILGGQLVAALHLVMAWTSNPVPRRYLGEWIEQGEALRGVPFDPADGRDLSELQLTPSFSLATYGDEPQVVFDVAGAPNGVAVAVAGRHSSSISLVSRLSDGRLAVTADSALLPHPMLVSAVAPSSEPAEVLAAHRALLAAQFEQRRRPVPVTPEIAHDLLRVERRSWEAVGPLLGPFFSLTGRSKPWRLTHRLDPADLPSVGPGAHPVAEVSRLAPDGRSPSRTTERTPTPVA